MVNEWSNDRGLNAADFPNVSSLKNWRINGDNIKYLGENKDSGSCEYGIYIQENQIAVGELFSAGRLKTTVERRVNELELIQAVYGTIKREKVVTDIGYDAKRAYWIIRRPYVSFYETIGYRETIDPIGMPRLYDARRDPNQEKLAFLRSVSERVAQAVKRWCQDDYAKWSSRDSLGLKDVGAAISKLYYYYLADDESGSRFFFLRPILTGGENSLLPM
ncbi:hypothetical protein FRC03_001679 [Tulasnella sp. 419]|nr:hypothetical protein FRC03_001679 [Tulasnella sp. 419]